MARNDRKFIGCDCQPGEFTAIADAEKNGVRYDVMGAGDSPEAAEADAEEHAFRALGDDAVIHNVKPA